MVSTNIYNQSWWARVYISIKPFQFMIKLRRFQQIKCKRPKFLGKSFTWPSGTGWHPEGQAILPTLSTEDKHDEQYAWPHGRLRGQRLSRLYDSSQISHEGSATATAATSGLGASWTAMAAALASEREVTDGDTLHVEINNKCKQQIRRF